MGFRVVPKSMTLTDLKRLIYRYFAILPNSTAIGTITPKWLKIDLCCATKMRSKESSFFNVCFMAIFAEVTENV